MRTTEPAEKASEPRTQTIKPTHSAGYTTGNVTTYKGISKAGPKRESELSKLNRSLEQDDSTWGMESDPIFLIGIGA